MNDGKRRANDPRPAADGSVVSKKRFYASLQERQHAHRVLFRMLVFVAIVLAFLGGFLLRSNTDLMGRLGLYGADISVAATSISQKTTFNSLSARLSEAEDLLSTYSMTDIDLETVSESVLTSLLDSLNDPYAEYFDEERYQTYLADAANSNGGGIGVLFADNEGRAYATDVLENSEAASKGVVSGCYVVAVDGDSSHSWSSAEVISAISQAAESVSSSSSASSASSAQQMQESQGEGLSQSSIASQSSSSASLGGLQSSSADDSIIVDAGGPSIIITWSMPSSISGVGNAGEFTTTLAVTSYTQTNVSTSLVDNIGYIRISQITDNSYELVRQAVMDLGGSGAAALVLDLRNNSGGYLTRAVEIANAFIPSGVIVGVQSNEGTTTRNATGDVLTDSPMVVLVNEYTSAAAEVLASALQDNGRATVAGTTSMGKGSVQVIRELSFGGAVRYTAAYYISPLGHEIEGVGVVPDVEVSANSDSADAASEDNQLNVAMDIARSLVS